MTRRAIKRGEEEEAPLMDEYYYIGTKNPRLRKCVFPPIKITTDDPPLITHPFQPPLYVVCMREECGFFSFQDDVDCLFKQLTLASDTNETGNSRLEQQQQQLPLLRFNRKRKNAKKEIRG